MLYCRLARSYEYQLCGILYSLSSNKSLRQTNSYLHRPFLIEERAWGSRGVYFRYVIIHVISIGNPQYWGNYYVDF